MTRHRLRHAPTETPVPHDDLKPEDEGLQAPNDYLDEFHPDNDQYIKGVEHVQRQLVHATRSLRPKQVEILKTIFAGANFTQTAKKHGTTAVTVSRLVKSPNGERLLSLLQYHLKLLEGPQEAQRRAMLWRIAQREEINNPKTSIVAMGELNKMHNFEKQLTQDKEVGKAGGSTQAPTVIVNIDQKLMPRGKLD